MSKVDNAGIAKILTDKGADKPCHRCGHEDFAIINKYTYIPLQESLSQSITLGGAVIPAILTICINCGSVNFHALAGLGLLPEHHKGEGEGDYD
jgi:ribosomal protein L37E